MQKKYCTVKEAAEIFSIKPARLRQYAHARGQRFAVQPVKNGNLQIDIAELDKWLKMYRA